MTLGSVRLAGGATLTVRVAGPDDERHLRRFYDQLPPDDQYRRFFNGAHAWEKLLAGWLAMAPEAGVRLVAVIDEGEVVGDCGYFVDDADPASAELDITVAPRLRGWLGPYLLDNLVDVAAGHGVEELRATVLRTNRAMLALLQGRGDLVVGHDEATSVELLIATRHGLPRWPEGHAAPRLLVESRDGDWHAADSARSFGMQVVVCPGPGAGLRCSELEGKPCPLARDADAIVVALPADDPETHVLLRAHADLHPDTVLCVESRGAVGDLALELVDAVVQLDPDDPMAAAEILSELGHEPELPHRPPGSPGAW